MFPITLQLPLRTGEGFGPAGAQPPLHLQELTEFPHCGSPQRLTSPIITARLRHVRGAQVVHRALAATPEPRHQTAKRIDVRPPSVQGEPPLQTPLRKGVEDATEERELRVFMLRARPKPRQGIVDIHKEGESAPSSCL